jgi:hypothetical protein
MNEAEELAYSLGERAVNLRLLRGSLHALGVESVDPLIQLARRTSEREEALMVLRRLCVDHGDMAWDSSIHIADILEKHLGRYLDGRARAAMQSSLGPVA